MTPRRSVFVRWISRIAGSVVKAAGISQKNSTLSNEKRTIEPFSQPNPAQEQTSKFSLNQPEFKRPNSVIW